MGKQILPEAFFNALKRGYLFDLQKV